MKGDFTRSTFKPEKHYSSVRMQQGRVQLDADWNEQADIVNHRIEIETRDIIGQTGAPISQPDEFKNFKIKSVASGLEIASGCIYVDGILCINEQNITPVTATKQPYLPDDSPIVRYLDNDVIRNVTLSNTPPGTYLVYLDVWRRHITASEDEDIREKALGGPDTATRTQTVWQVKLGKVKDDANCSQFGGQVWSPETETKSTGKLSAQTKPPDISTDKCRVSSAAGYSGLENQLYRIEIHDSGKEGAASFKWSRDNGSIIFPLKSISIDDNLNQTTITLEHLGRDLYSSLNAGDWVEIVDDDYSLKNDAKKLLKVVSPPSNNVIILDGIADPNVGKDSSKHPLLRRWDHKDVTLTDNASITLVLSPAGAIKIKEKIWIELEEGLQIQFNNGGYYRTGDYWLIPARTANADKQAGTIEWPYTDPQPPHGIKHYYCPLALVSYDSVKKEWHLKNDCRRLFPVLTELTTIHYVSGDGQEAMPGETLPQPLQVRVANGQWPVIGAKVKFTKEMGSGTLNCQEPVLTVGPNGIASCNLTLGNDEIQQVSATLLDAAGEKIDGQVVYFNANLSIASDVAFNPADSCSELRTKDGNPVSTVQEAIDALCRLPRGREGCCCVKVERGRYKTLDEAIYSLLKEKLKEKQADICFCIPAGEHELLGLVKLNEFIAEFKKYKKDINVKIQGCGRGTHIDLLEPIYLKGFSSFTLRDIEIGLDEEFKLGEQQGAITFENCNKIRIESCHLSGVIDKKALLVISGTSKVRFSNNNVEIYTSDELQLSEDGAIIFDNCGEVTIESCHLGGVIGKKALMVISRTDKVRLSNNFIVALQSKKVSGTAIVLTKWVPKSTDKIVADPDENNFTLIESNDITGIVSIGGMPDLMKFDIEKLINLIKESEEVIKIKGAGTIQIRGNKLTNLTISNEIIQHIVKERHIENVFGRYFFNGNILEGTNNIFLAQDLFMNSNSFTKKNNIGIANADSAIFVGNHGTGDLYNISNNSKEAANIGITFIPSFKQPIKPSPIKPPRKRGPLPPKP